MNAAASSGNGGFGFGGQSANEGYAIPVEEAMAIAEQIQSGDGTDTIHVGATPGRARGQRAGQRLRRSVRRQRRLRRARQSADNGDGAYVSDVQSGSGADSAGIESGVTIVGIDGDTVSSARELTHSLVKYSPERRSRDRVDRRFGPEPHRHDRARVRSPRLTRDRCPGSGNVRGCALHASPRCCRRRRARARVRCSRSPRSRPRRSLRVARPATPSGSSASPVTSTSRAASPSTDRSPPPTATSTIAGTVTDFVVVGDGDVDGQRQGHARRARRPRQRAHLGARRR